MKGIKAIIQTHMSSTRLPGKVLLDIHGQPELYRVIERCSQAKSISDIIIATSTLECDDIIAEKCDEWGVHCYRGSDTDVLSRYWGAAQQYSADVYFRITSDNPLNDAGFLDGMASFFEKSNVRYLGGNGKNPIGVGGEIFTSEILEEAALKSTEDYEHEHVTPYMYWKQDSIGRYPYEPDHSMYRLTMDTPEDYQVIQAIYAALYQDGNRFTLQEILRFLQEHPEIASINSSIVQKKVK